MEDTGYRSPQFSEETAWLPAWLRPCRMQSLTKEERETDAFAQVPNGLQETPSYGKPFSTESARCSNFRLFLSGKDDCSAGNSLSIENVLPFQLYLSSGTSGQSLSQLRRKREGEGIFPDSGACLACISESSVLKNIEGLQIQVADSVVQDMLPKVGERRCSNCPSWNFNNHTEEEHASSALLKDTDVNNAVELAVAASEALAVSEVVSNSVPCHAFSVSTILEVALRLKEARIQSRIDKPDISIISSDEVDEMVSLSDLDEDVMEDAFSDVGLTISKVVTGDNSFRVRLDPEFANPNAEICEKSSPPANMEKNASDVQVSGAASNPHFAQGLTSFSKEVFSLCTSSTPTHISESPVGSLPNMQKDPTCQEIHSLATFNEKRIDAAAAADGFLVTTRLPVTTDTPSESSKRSKELRLSGKFGSHHSKATPTSLSSIPDPGTGDSWILEKAMLVEPFCSRWLGGWTGKEANLDAVSSEQLESQTTTGTPSWVRGFRDVEAELVEMAGSTESSADHWHDGPMRQDVKLVVQRGCNNTRGRSRFFVEETSFLSESVAELDEGSVAHKAEGYKIADGPTLSTALCSSILPLETSGSSNSVSVFFSQPIASPTSSLDDPLCSVVECSIPGEDARLHVDSITQNLEAERWLRAKSTFTGNLELHGLCANAKLTTVEGLKSSCTGLGEIKRTVLASLQSYSMPISFKKMNLFEHKEVNLLKDFLRHRDQSESYMQKLPCQGCCKSSNQEKQSLATNLLEPQFDCRDSGVCSPINFDGCVNDLHGQGCTTGKQILKNTNAVSPIEASGDGIIMHQTDWNYSPSVWSNRTRHRLQPCRPVDKDVNREHNLSEAGEICLRKASPCRSRKEPCRENQPPCQLEQREHEKGPLIKKVRFAENEERCLTITRKSSSRIRSCLRQKQRTGKKSKGSALLAKLKKENKGGNGKAEKRIAFRGFEFILTGFTRHEKQELEVIIRKYGGIVLPDIPSPSPRHRGKKRLVQKGHILTVILSPRKVQTTKFLYGCAVSAYLLKVDWLMDSISVGSLLPPDRYFLAGRKHMDFERTASRDEYIFHGVGVMLYGKARFCSKYAKLIEHGGGQVFKTLRWLTQNLNNHKIKIGAIVVEDVGHATRHLRHCAAEYKLNMMPASWITGSLLSGEVLPLDGKYDADLFRPTKEGRIEGLDSSQEI